MKIGFIARYDNSGLGILSLEFMQQMQPHKTLAVANGVYKTFPERLEGYDCRQTSRNISDDDVDWLLEGIDVLVAVETTYAREVFLKARKKGVKSVLIPMYESLGESNSYTSDSPDLYICPSLLDFRSVNDRKILLPFPVNREKVKFIQREKAQIFLHNAGHGGMASRNGTTELLEAIPMIQNKDILIVINSQTPIECNDPRVKINVGNVRNYWDMWREGDVFVFPEKFNGLSLPVNEALSSGMVVMSTNRYPFNEWIPREPLIEAVRELRVKVSARLVDYAIIKPEAIANKIDEFAMQDISELSKQSDKIAESISWKKLKPEYIKVLENLCKS